MGTYSESIKADLCGQTVKAPCCRKAFLYGLLIRAEIDEDGTVSTLLPALKTPDGVPAPGETAAGLVRKLLGRDTETLPVTRGAHRYVCLRFVSRQAADVIRSLSAAGEDEDSTGEMVAEEAIGFKCESCANYFLRGVFIASGSVSDPKKSLHLEMRVPADGRAECVAALWNMAGITPGVTTRADECGIWFKKYDTLQEAIGLLGGIRTYLELANDALMREVRDNEIRATNWEAVNIGRAVSAGQRDSAFIHDLQAWGLLDKLSPELQETAQLRVLHGDLPLSELAALHIPPVSKSGLNHRLAKLRELWNREKQKRQDEEGE